MTSVFATVLFGLAAALFWGSGDFSGGLASRRANPTSVVLTAYAVGFVLLVGLAFVFHEPFPSLHDIFWGGLSGIVGSHGLIAFYSALSIGQMGIIAPLSALLNASIPVIFSIFTLGLPGSLQIVGFVVALLAVGFVSSSGRAEGRPAGIRLALLAGCGFGLFFVLISRVSPGSTFWPLAVARLTSVIVLLVLLQFRGQQKLPSKHVGMLVILAGGLDALGNAFFVLAAHIGRLDVAAVLSSLYPAATVLLATILLRERMTRIQTLGIALALIAIPLISTHQ